QHVRDSGRRAGGGYRGVSRPQRRDELVRGRAIARALLHDRGGDLFLAVKYLLVLFVLAAVVSPHAQQPSAPSPQDAARWRAYHERIISVVATSSARISLASILGPVLQTAHQRSSTDDAVLEAKTALMALMVYVNGWPIEAFMPDARSWPPAPRRTVVLRERY